MKAITQLFDESFLTEKREEWLAIGLSTEPLDFDTAKKYAAVAYRAAGLNPPATFLSASNPVDASAMVVALEKPHITKVMDHQVMDHQVRYQVWSQVGDQVRRQIRLQVGDQVRGQVRDQILARIVLEGSHKNKVFNQVWGNHLAGELSYYDCFSKSLTCIKKLDGLMGLARSGGWFIPLRNICILQDRPTKLSMVDKKLHCDGGAAIHYDGINPIDIYALQGTRVPEWLAVTSADKLDANQVLKETNAEVRMRGIQKIGVERLLSDLPHTLLDTEGHYSLLKIQLADDLSAHALKMLNPSVDGLWHIEFVPPEFTTVNEALNFRNGLDDETIDENGADWYQQGDVIIRPDGAKKFKSRPIILT